jgi:hypothetical protein
VDAEHISEGSVRLLRQDELPVPLCSLGRSYLLALCRAGKLPLTVVKLTAHSEPLFAEPEVSAFVAAKLKEARERVQ